MNFKVQGRHESHPLFAWEKDRNGPDREVANTSSRLGRFEKVRLKTFLVGLTIVFHEPGPVSP